MPGADPPIVVEGLHKSYRRGSTVTPVLRGIDLVVHPGECVILAGPSGSGKTTLLSILGCILTAQRGMVRILGHDLDQLENHCRTLLRRDKIGFVFQRFHLIRGLSALENVCIPLSLRGTADSVSKRRGSALLEAVGMADHLRSHAANLSVGQCQRVALARALVGEPDLILADEPTASLDADTGLEVMRLLYKLTIEQGKAAVVVTHDERIFEFADRICHLENGQVRASDESGYDAALGKKPPVCSGSFAPDSGETPC